MHLWISLFLWGFLNSKICKMYGFLGIQHIYILTLLSKSELRQRAKILLL